MHVHNQCFPIVGRGGGNQTPRPLSRTPNHDVTEIREHQPLGREVSSGRTSRASRPAAAAAPVVPASEKGPSVTHRRPRDRFAYAPPRIPIRLSPRAGRHHNGEVTMTTNCVLTESLPTSQSTNVISRTLPIASPYFYIFSRVDSTERGKNWIYGETKECIRRTDYVSASLSCGELKTGFLLPW